MIWVSWRQFRAQALAGCAVLAVVAITLGVTGVHLEHLYTAYKDGLRTCSAVTCGSAQNKVLNSYDHIRLFGTALIVVPAVIGVFWGAPLITRELEAGTQRLAWTQSVSRTRWIATKLGVVGLGSAVLTGLFSLAVSWWALPFDRINDNRLSPAFFDQRGIVPIGYALFAFALGVAFGVVLRRTLPAMAATLVGFIGIRLLVQFVARPHLIAPLHKTLPLSPAAGIGVGVENGVVGVFPSSDGVHGAWVTGSVIVNSHGQAPTAGFLRRACAGILNQPPPPADKALRLRAPASAQRAFSACIHNVGLTYHEVLTYQPDSRFWEFQALETAIFVALALGLAALSVFLVRRRLS